MLIKNVCEHRTTRFTTYNYLSRVYSIFVLFFKKFKGPGIKYVTQQNERISITYYVKNIIHFIRKFRFTFKSSKIIL